jgi:CRISPR-associated protein Cmr2
VGRNPILIECVPAGAEGTFTLLYIPFGRPNAESGIATCCRDLSMIAAAVWMLFVETGVSAKTSSGYGRAEERLREGAHAIRLKTGYQDIKVVDSSSVSELRDAAARLREQGIRAQRGAR